MRAAFRYWLLHSDDGDLRFTFERDATNYAAVLVESGHLVSVEWVEEIPPAHLGPNDWVV